MATFKIKKSGDGQFYWVFVADNHEPVCTSETYKSKQSAEHAISVIQEEAASAKVDDQTD